MVRSLIGGEAAAPAPTRQSGEARLDDILSIKSVPLRALFEDRYHRGVAYNDVAQRENIAAFAAAFADDPLPVALDLLVRAPMMNQLHRLQNTDSTRILKAAFSSALESGRDRKSVV